jgi:hypothetical protein
MAFSPPLTPYDGEEYTYGNVVWKYQNPPGVWNIKDGTLVGTNGVGVSGFFIGQGGEFTQGHLYFYYVYPGGATSDEISLGQIAASVGDLGITFAGSNGTKDAVNPGETITITGAGPTVRTSIAGNNMTVDVRITESGKTGVAMFNTTQFDIGGDGLVGLKGAYSTTGDTVTGPNAAIKVNKTGNTASIDARLADTSVTGVAYFDNTQFTVTNGKVSITSPGNVVAPTGINRVVFTNPGLSANQNFLFNGTSLTFGGSGTLMTVTGPTMALGFNTNIVDGVFKTPREFSSYVNNGASNEVVINATGGSIQRFLITPQNTQFKVKAGTGWSNVSGHVETVVALLQSTNTTTGGFDDNIIVQPKPSLFGVAGGIDIVSIMRIKTDSGGLTMGFVYSTGLTGSGYAFS